ncbi:NADPH:quinone oxidoreductase family protein [Frondihabitans australicus]|uniref:NADPH:quinone reductase-like Zn-dependent oxidoreductase n=1 Tax=Frondihabitans australicus TaxID=386892 RepID=A0A495IH27_9MICO|nr:NADPH:quinone oxidoreductase family protein [Frondihabitans australicus]RKR74376.1 NADPH:quinone reductase-like Zn-dependent oxidoreductase [Frondihabitans australicus]
MKAVVIESLEGPEAARLTDFPEPAGAHERARGQRVLVDVHAAGLSVIDNLQARGRYQYGTSTPYVVGSEVAGVVTESESHDFAVGDRVGAIVFWGGVAEKCLVAPEYTAKLPDAMPFADGAALYLNYSTAWFAYHRAEVRPGQTVLVQGAAGGVGTAALDLAAAFGAKAIAVVSSDEKAEVAKRAGAWAVVRSDANWLAEVRDLTDGHGVDVVLDPVGGDRFTDSLRSLRIGGTLVVIGFVGGEIPEVRVNRLLLRNLKITGISMDTMDAEYPGTLRLVRDSVQALLDEGRIHPFVGHRYPMADTVAALTALEERSTLGKVVVEVRP